MRVSRDGPRAIVTMARPAVRNAFNAELIAALDDAFLRLGGDATVRYIVLAGEGKTFSGGADVNWMRASLDLSEDDNLRDAQTMAKMYRQIDRCGKPVIARVQGAALGGGVGLCAVSDVVVAADDAVFGFTEVKLGIVPAVISPFVVPKIGVSHARALFVTGERFDARRAAAIGLVHRVVAPNALDAEIEAVGAELLSSGPEAMIVAKSLAGVGAFGDSEDAARITTTLIAARRTSAEGQEGLRAFLERRDPSWHGR